VTNVAVATQHSMVPAPAPYWQCPLQSL